MSRDRLPDAAAGAVRRPLSESAGPGACPLCGEMGRAWGRLEGVELRRCDACGTSLAWGWPSPIVYSRLYTEGERYHRAEALRHGHPPHRQRFHEHCLAAECRVRALFEFVNGGDLLDVGAGNGAFVHVARIRGFDAEGLEPNLEMVRWLGERRVPLRRGSWIRADGCRDVITLHDVIEHLPDPVACLRHLRRHLRLGGLLVVETPEWTPERTIDWRHLKPREHLCLYSEEALRALLEGCGYEVVDVRRPIEDKLAIYVRNSPHFSASPSSSAARSG